MNDKTKDNNLKVAPKNNVKEGKPRPSFLPMDILIKHLTPAYEEGDIKYERESWRDGFLTSVLFDATQRHLSKFFYEGEDYDPDAEKLGIKKHHLAGALFSILSILHTLDTRPELDDRFSKTRDNMKERQLKHQKLPSSVGIISVKIPDDLFKDVEELTSRISRCLPSERKKAKRQLNWTLKRNGLNLGDLRESDEPKKRSFKVMNSREHLILQSLIDFPCKWSKDDKSGVGKYIVFVWLTNLQYQRINRAFKVQRNQFRQQANDALDALLDSFISSAGTSGK